jgi:phage-related protein
MPTQAELDNEVLKSELPGYVELFELNFATANIPGLTGYFRCSPTKVAGGSLLFGGDTFIGNFPIKIEGIEYRSGSAPARPQLTVANIDKYFGSLLFTYGDIAKTTVIYYRTFTPYLGQTTRLSKQPLKFQIAKKLDHSKKLIIFELRDPTDRERNYMPGRQMLRDEFPGLGVNKHA